MGLGLGMIQKLNFERSLLDLSYFLVQTMKYLKAISPSE